MRRETGRTSVAELAGLVIFMIMWAAIMGVGVALIALRALS